MNGYPVIADLANTPPTRFDVASRMGLTMAGCLEPGLFPARTVNLDVGTPLLVKAIDGSFWAEVTARTPDGFLVIEAMAQPVARASNPTRKAA